MLSDNWALLKGKELLGLLYPFNIAWYNQQHFDNLTWKDKLYLKVQKVGFSIFHKKIFLSKRPFELFPNSISEKAKLHKLFYMVKGNKFSCVKTTKKQMVELIYHSQKEELGKAQVLDSWDYWDKVRQCISDSLPTKGLYLVTVPHDYTEDIHLNS